MKTLLLFLIFSLQLAQAQTSYSEVDIDGASGTKYETLLTNVEYAYNDASIQHLLGDMEFVRSGELKYLKNVLDFTIKYESQRNKNLNIYVHFIGKKLQGKNLPLTTKVEIYGDVTSVIKFYINFWSTELNFDDIKKGEVVSNRFLSDIATLSFPDANTAKITVVSAKDR